jgi:UDP-N-acetylglucosamine acyltransferase
MKQHPLSVVHPNAKIGENVEIGPFVYIEEDVVIGDNTWIGPSVSIMNGTRIGKDCRFFQGAIVGNIPQDLKFKNEITYLEIGNNVTVREYCTLNRGTDALGKTVIKDNCLLMAYVHVAHDCIVGENVILANNTNLAGHIEIGDYAILGGLTAVHQFVKIGAHAFIGGGSLVSKDVPPFIRAAREPLSYAGINTVGLGRRGFTSEQRHNIKEIYGHLFVKGFNQKTALSIIKNEMIDTPEKDYIVDFIENQSKRGVLKGFRTVSANKAVLANGDNID